MAPSTALETAADDSNAIMDKTASLSPGAIKKSSDNQNAATAAVETPTTLHIKPDTVSKFRKLRPQQYCKVRRAH
jgi:hypothetical protein